MKTLRKLFFTGLFILVPIVATLSLIVWLFNIIDSIFRVPIEKIIGFRIIGIGVALTIGIILATGVFATNYLGKEMIHFVEKADRKSVV